MSYLDFMRRSIVGLLLSLSLVACDKAETDVSDIAYIPISDAAYIFEREGSRSRSSDEGFSGVWKVTVSGEEIKLKALDIEGNEIDVEIFDVQNILGGNYVRFGTVFGPMFADKKTNKVYKANLALFADANVVEYPAGTLYYNYGRDMYTCQITSQSIVEKPLLPEGQEGEDLFVGQNGTIYYSLNCYSPGGKVMTKDKRLYTTDDAVLMFGSADHNIYSVDKIEKLDGSGNELISYSVYKWENSGNNEISKKFICDMPNSEFGYVNKESIIQFAPINTKNGKVVLFQKLQLFDGGIYNDIYNVYEFDGKSCKLMRSYTTDNERDLVSRFIQCTSSYFGTYGKRAPYKILSKSDAYFEYNSDNAMVIKLDPMTYEIEAIPYDIPKKQYEVYEKRTDASWGKMLFTALRYSDGSIVMGEVDDKGNVKIISERASTYHITEYFALN